jgi:hypothetical protein
MAYQLRGFGALQIVKPTSRELAIWIPTLVLLAVAIVALRMGGAKAPPLQTVSRT